MEIAQPCIAVIKGLIAGDKMFHAPPAAGFIDAVRHAADERDRSREAAPLRPADDAHLLDTSDLDIEAAFQAAVDIVERHLNA